MPSYAEETEEPFLRPGVLVGLGLLGAIVIAACIVGIVVLLNQGSPAAEESPILLPERSTDVPEEPTAVPEEPTAVPEIPTAFPAQPTAEPAQPTAVPPTAAPTSTRERTQTSVPTNCTDDSQFVRDVTIPDGTVLQPGVAFTKVWEIMNSGTCPWDAAYRFVYIGGDRMSAPSSVPVGEVEPGESITISVNLIAPSNSGQYRANFQMENADGERFADRPWVLIVVSP
jgi:hypothetical protein